MTAPLLAIDELCRYMDGELSPSARAQVESKLKQCEISRQRLEVLTRLMGMIRQAILTAPVQESPRTVKCLDEADLPALLDGQLGPGALAEIETHILACSRCLRLVLDHFRAAVAIRVGDWPPIPEEAKKRAEARFLVNLQERDPIVEQWESIRYDPSTNEAILRVIHGEEFTAQVELSPVRNGATISIRCLLKNTPLKNRRIVIERIEPKSKVLSDATNARGTIKTPRLAPGEYTILFAETTLNIKLKILD